MSIYLGRNSRNTYLASLLYHSIDDNDFSAVKYLLEKGADPNTIFPNRGISPFHLAVGLNEDFASKATQLILNHGGDPNVRSEDNLTPVHIAAAWGRAEILKLLLNRGGDPELRDANNCTALNYVTNLSKGSKRAELLQILTTYTPAKYGQCTEDRKVCDKVDLNTAFIEDDFENHVEKYEDKKHVNSLSQPTTNKYVEDWVEKHVETYSSWRGDHLSFDSSIDESESERFNSKPNKPPIVRKYYKAHKTNKSTNVPNSLLSIKLFTSESTIEKKNSCKKMSKVEPTSNVPPSAESGIIIPLDEGNKPINDCNSKKYIDIPTVRRKSFGRKLGHAETSSDYMTCSNEVFDNISKLTEDITLDLLTLEESSGVKKSEKDDSSYFSVQSEVYRYEDKEEGVILYEKKVLKASNEFSGNAESGLCSSKMSSVPDSFIYDTDTLRKELTLHGYNPGPITNTTKRIYLKKLYELKKHPVMIKSQLEKHMNKTFSIEIEKTRFSFDWFGNNLTLYKSLEETVTKELGNPDVSKKWREGVNKTSFTYLLLDPRITQNLPCRSENLDLKKTWETFLFAVFYIGKGKKSRPYSHLYEAVSFWKQGKADNINKKVQYILDIWKSDSGVVCLHVFHNTIPVEAYTREAAMINAMKVENLTNIKTGDFYGITASWPQKHKKLFGTFLLYKAMMIFLNDGERQIYPCDVD